MENGQQAPTSSVPNNFALLRLATALLVIYAHAFAVTDTPMQRMLGIEVDSLRLKAFFAMSGFLVCLSWIRDPHPVRYVHRRLLRVVPAFFVCIILTAYVFGPMLSSMSLEGYFADAKFKDYHWNLLFWIKYQLPGVFSEAHHGPAVNGSIWMLPLELSFYIMLPVVAVIASTWRPWGALVVVGLAAVCVYVSTRGVPGDLRIYSVSVNRWVLFAPYVLFSAALAALILRKPIPLPVGLAVIGVLLFVKWPSGYGEYVAVVLVSMTWIFIGQTRALFPNLVERVGDLSYGTFLYGFIIQQCLVEFGIYPDSQIANFLLTAPLAMGAGWLSWHLVEKPMLRFRPGRTTGRAQPAPSLEPRTLEETPSLATAGGKADNPG